MTINENIIDKIKKLFALSHGNENENEAAAAAGAAQKLMLKYNITKAMVSAFSDQEKSLNSQLMSRRYDVLDIWELYLAEVVSEHSQCYSIGKSKNCQVIAFDVWGLPTDIDFFNEMFIFLKNELIQILNSKCHPSEISSMDWCKIFYLSAIAAVKLRLALERQDSMKAIKAGLEDVAVKSGLEIVVVSQAIEKVDNLRDQIRDIVDEMSVNLTELKEEINIEMQDAAIKGFKEGSQMNLRRLALEQGNKLKGE